MQCQRLVVAGDAHLGRGSEQTEAAFLAFLDAVPSLGDGLLVTGDLFEFWFSYARTVPRRGARVMGALAQVARRLPVLFVGGNHDRWGGTFWETDLGIGFASREARFTVAGRAGLALHGDGLGEVHWTGRVLNGILRNQGTVALYHALHPDLGIWLVDRLSGFLGHRERGPDEVKLAASRQLAWAERRMAAEPGTGLLIMGHTHRAATAEPAPGRHYLNPGAWFDGYRYATVSEGPPALHQFTP